MRTLLVLLFLVITMPLSFAQAPASQPIENNPSDTDITEDNVGVAQNTQNTMTPAVNREMTYEELLDYFNVNLSANNPAPSSHTEGNL